MKDNNELESEIITTEEIETEIIDEKKEKKFEPKKKRNRKLIRRIINIAIWILLFGWMILVIIDYINIHNNKKPQFCWFNEKVTNYEDGKVTECMGIGYKVINYKRTSFNAMEFGPFWIKDRSKEK